jgi:hypothetical protein
MSRLGVFKIITGYHISWTLAGFKDLRQSSAKCHLHETAPAHSPDTTPSPPASGKDKPSRQSLAVFR